MFRVAIAIVLLFSMPAAAGSPQERMRKWWVGPQAHELGLSDAQSRSIEAIHQQAVPRLEQAMQDLDNAQKELNRLIAADKTTEMDVVRQINIVQAARNELNRQFVLMLYRQYRELRPDQRVKVREMFERREQERRDGRRGQSQDRPPIKK